MMFFRKNVRSGLFTDGAENSTQQCRVYAIRNFRRSARNGTVEAALLGT